MDPPTTVPSGALTTTDEQPDCPAYSSSCRFYKPFLLASYLVGALFMLVSLAALVFAVYHYKRRARQAQALPVDSAGAVRTVSLEDVEIWRLRRLESRVSIPLGVRVRSGEVAGRGRGVLGRDGGAEMGGRHLRTESVDTLPRYEEVEQGGWKVEGAGVVGRAV